MSLSAALLWLWLSISMFYDISIQSKRLYKHQFPDGADHMSLPRVVLMSVYMGKITYTHMPLLMESMRWNPLVQFIIINIVPTGSTAANETIALEYHMNVTNFQLIVMSMDDWRQRVRDRLGLDITWDITWSYKLCDYKPVLAHLFPELVGEEYKYWGFGDMDVIWGNFSKFAGWFQGQPVVITGLRLQCYHYHWLQIPNFNRSFVFIQLFSNNFLIISSMLFI